MDHKSFDIRTVLSNSLSTLIVALPIIVFVAVNALTSLTAALFWTALTAIIIFGFRLYLRKPVGSALAGLSIAAVCAVIAGVAGQAKAFFLFTGLILPMIISAMCIVSIVIRQPLAGYLLNSLAGGPARWFEMIRLRRIYSNATWVCLGVNIGSALVQRFFYIADQTLLLGAMHIVTPVVFTIIIAVTMFYARRRINFDKFGSQA